MSREKITFSHAVASRRLIFLNQFDVQFSQRPNPTFKRTGTVGANLLIHRALRAPAPSA